MALKRKLMKAFAAVAIFGGALTIAAPPAHANAVVVIMMNNARQQGDHAAKSAAIADPSPQNIETLKNRGIVDASTVPYIAETVREMNISPGAKPADITYAQHVEFIQKLQDKRLVAEMSAGTAAEAQQKGLSPDLAKYYEATRAGMGYNGPVTLSQAKAVNQSLEQQHWEHDTKPALKGTGLILGGLAAVGSAGYMLGRRRNGGYNY
jgi:hypothetical protein